MSARCVASVVLLAVALICGCRKDAAPEAASSAAKLSPTSNDVTLRVRKLGGADGKQELNQFSVTTPLGDEFTVTEQVGATQRNFRGNVTALPNGKFRVSHEYSETSAGGQKQVKGTIDIPPDTETELGGLLAAEGMERITLTISRT